MGGQDGYARDPLDYETDSDTLMAGVKLKPSESFGLGLNLSWTESQASIAPISISADDYVATHATTSYDFSQTHTYSDLDVSRLETELSAWYQLHEGFFLKLRYRFADYQDDAPYLSDTDGTIDLYSASLIWKF